MTYIYVIGTDRDDGLIGGPVKVGISDNPMARINGIQTGNPKSLSIILQFKFSERTHAALAERTFHLFGKMQRQSGEWFDITPGLASRMMVRVVHGVLKEFESDYQPEAIASINRLSKASEEARSMWDGSLRHE